jgi:hypothetical protein
VWARPGGEPGRPADRLASPGDGPGCADGASGEVDPKAGPKQKTDGFASFEWADRLRMMRLLEVHVPSPRLNDCRQPLRYRIGLGKVSQLVRSQIHALRVHTGVRADVHDAFGVERRKRIATAQLPESPRHLLDGLLTQPHTCSAKPNSHRPNSHPRSPRFALDRSRRRERRADIVTWGSGNANEPMATFVRR